MSSIMLDPTNIFVFCLIFGCSAEISGWYPQGTHPHIHPGLKVTPAPTFLTTAAYPSTTWTTSTTDQTSSNTNESTSPNSVKSERPLHEILNVTKDEVNARDLRSSEAEASAFAAGSGSGVPPPPPPFYQPYPLGGSYSPFGSYPGFLPGFGVGAGAGLNFGLDILAEGGIFGGFFPYFPIVEKVIVIVGGGILILVLLTLVQSYFTKKGGLLDHFLSIGGTSGSLAHAGSFGVNAGPFHASKGASFASSASFDHSGELANQVMKGVHSKW